MVFHFSVFQQTIIQIYLYYKCNNAVASRTELVYLVENMDLYNTCVGVVYNMYVL